MVGGMGRGKTVATTATDAINGGDFDLWIVTRTETFNRMFDPF